MARDYTKYTVEGLGENLNKRKLVFTVVKDYVEKNNPSFEDLQKAFPDEVQGSKGVVAKEAEIKDPKRYNVKEPLKIKNGAHVVVCNQWGEKNILAFLSLATKLKYNISEDNKVEEESATAETNVSSTSNVINSVKSYICIKVEDNNKGNDLALVKAEIVQTNGKYTLCVDVESVRGGVNDRYYFYDIKTKVSGTDSAPWGFEEFTDEDYEWTDHKSLEDFGYDSNEISEKLYNMRLEFIKKYLNEASQENFLDEAAMPFEKRDMLKEDVFTGLLVFEECDKSIVPEF